MTRERIVDVAIELVERDGPDALSMRRLGLELGVEGMALYHYFAGREELLQGIGDKLLEAVGDLEMAGDWRETCRAFADALRDIAKARPAAFRLVGLQPFDTAASLQLVERLLHALVSAGFAAPEALGVYRAVASYARGYALAEASGFNVDAANFRGRQRLRTLDRRAFPILAGRADELARLHADSAYELGLRALLDGLPDPTRR